MAFHEAVVNRAREPHLAGAAVLRGPVGFGADSRIQMSKILRLSEGLPIVVEIVDAPEKVAAFLPQLETMVAGGLVTIEDVGVVISSPAGSDP